MKNWLRGGLVLLAASALTVGLWALPAPRAFYEDFPIPGRGWISALGPYNEHLVRDVGAMYLALGVLLTLAAVLLERRLVQASLITWLVFAVPHFVFHLTKSHVFSFGDNLAQLGSLGFLVLLPLALLFVVPYGATESLKRVERPDR